MSSSNPSGGVQVAGDRDRVAFVGGVGPDGQESDVVDDDQVGGQDAGDGLGD
jgi:hypothetical protein